MKTIGEFELIDHGIEHSQYFQGCGVAYTQWNNVVTGIGPEPGLAIEDCLEQIACGEGGWDIDDLEERIIEQEGWDQEGWDKFPDKPSVCGECEGADLDECQVCEMHYFVSIRWN